METRIKKTIVDEETLLKSKVIKIGDHEFVTPTKVMGINNMTATTQISNLSRRYLDRLDIIERSRIIRSDTFLREVDKDHIDFLTESYDLLKKTEPLTKKVVINSLTLDFNPFKISDVKDYLVSFFHIYYFKSDLLFIPNLKTLVYDQNLGKKVKTVSEEEYSKYVQIAYEALSFKTIKPIFVPLPLRYGVRIFRDMLSGMIDTGYRYFWMDFEGTNSISKAPHLRAFHEVIDRKGIEDKVILYATNVRRELNPHIQDIKCGASDVLVSPLGADFLGVNREPIRGFALTEPIKYSQEQILNHKIRFLDRLNYFYVQFSSFERREALLKEFEIVEKVLLKRPRFYTDFINTFEINAEFDVHKKSIIEEKSILDYLSKKEAITKDVLKAVKKIIKKKPMPEIDLNSFL